MNTTLRTMSVDQLTARLAHLAVVAENRAGFADWLLARRCREIGVDPRRFAAVRDELRLIERKAGEARP